MSPIRILLVDDHAVLRSGLKLLLQNHADIIVVGEAAEGREALNLAQSLQPDVILLDLTMPGMGGLDTLDSLRTVTPESRVLILTMHDDESYLHRALRAGAAGYILKKAVDAELLSAVRAVARGEVFIHSSMTHALLDRVDSATQSTSTGVRELWESLSDREKEVMLLVALGHTNAEIADLLSLSVKTIETYRARGMDKLRLRSRATLVKYALEAGLLGDSS